LHQISAKKHKERKKILTRPVGHPRHHKHERSQEQR
jgi:hypothetical protein